MASRKAQVTADPVSESTEAPVEQPAEVEYPPLEQLTEDTMSRLAVWGNSTRMTIGQLEGKAPGWSFLLNSLFETVGNLIEEYK